MAVRSPVARMRSLGSAHEGLGHWKLQRLTAIANVPLVLWFVFSAWALAGSGYDEVRTWLSSPITASLMILLIISVFYHARLGLQVVVEDYVQHDGIKLATLIAITLLTVALAVICSVSVLIVAIGG